jgi:hypothetical protein
MKHFALVIKLLLFAYLGYLVWFFLTTDGPVDRSYAPPFFLWILDTINLFIHEAGHLFLKPFGMWIYIFGGSFIQCALPLLLAIVTWRQNVTQLTYPAFWFGENLINVSYYIRDAPYKHLRLLAAGLIHDWNWLMGDSPEAAETIGTIVWGAGIFICVAAIGAGVYFAIQRFREDELEPMID